MNIQETVLANFQDLSIDKQKEVLTFIQFLKFQQENQPTTTKNMKGLWADLHISISEEDITEARKQMWNNFPREIN